MARGLGYFTFKVFALGLSILLTSNFTDSWPSFFPIFYSRIFQIFTTLLKSFTGLPAEHCETNGFPLSGTEIN